MNSILKKWMGLTAAAVLACSLIVLAGCSSSSSSSAASASSASASAASASASAASASAASASASAASAASASAASASSSSAATSSSAAELANPWHDAASAEEAAKGAGLESFSLPENEIADLGKIFNVTYRYMDGMAEARLELAASMITLRTAKIADGDSFDISGDYNAYAHEWTETIANTPIACAGNREGDSMKTYWGEGNIAHSIIARGGGGDADFGLNAERLTPIVEAMI